LYAEQVAAACHSKTFIHHIRGISSLPLRTSIDGPDPADTVLREYAVPIPKWKRLAVLTQPHFSDYLPYFWNSQSLLSSGQTWRALSHLEMQWKWNACCMRVSSRVAKGGQPRQRSPTLQIPQATVHSSLVADAWFAWHSMPEGPEGQQIKAKLYRVRMVVRT
jgi:hypothetical protein